MMMTESKLAHPVGLPINRVDAPLKVCGKATYAYEYAAQGDALYGVIVTASIAKGHIAAMVVRPQMLSVASAKAARSDP
jgi:xanthine dehydrogenase YagR molybdenum-binding subunit